MVMFPEWIAAAVLAAVGLAEWRHVRRVRMLAPLAFGPRRQPAGWTHIAIPLRTLAASAVAWGLSSLFVLPPKTHEGRKLDPSRIKHLVLVLDVSPSMKLTDAGPDFTQTRSERAAALLQSLFERAPMEQVRLSVIATYTSAKPVVVDTRDVAVVKNILADLPLSQAFEAGSTDLFSGLTEAARTAHAWPRGSTTLVVISDGDTVPSSGMPEMPPSVSHSVFIGVGDARAGQFIDGRQSRQDAAMLKQVAIRLRGMYHDGNQKHLPSDLLRDITALEAESPFERLTRREYALAALAAGSVVLAVLPWALYFLGVRYRPGRLHQPAATRGSRPTPILTR